MLSGSSQLLERNQELFAQGEWLLVNPTENAVFDVLDNANVSGFHQYFDVYQTCQNLHQKQYFAALMPKLGAGFDGVVIYLPKAKAHTQMLIANAMDVVKSNGIIAIVGSNDSGIKSIGKMLKNQFSQVQKYDAARHCALWLVNNDAQKPFKTEEYEKVSTYIIDDAEWRVCSLPGVFSHDGLDPGTELLLQSIPDVTAAEALDFACGAGVIGSYLALSTPQTKWHFSDINALALYACEKTLQLNEIDAEVKPSNGLSEWAQRFDVIVTNPPFHTGKQTDYSITETFIVDAKKHLNPAGDVYIVANRFLPYPELIDQHMKRQPDLNRSAKFSVYHATAK